MSIVYECPKCSFPVTSDIKMIDGSELHCHECLEVFEIKNQTENSLTIPFPKVCKATGWLLLISALTIAIRDFSISAKLEPVYRDYYSLLVLINVGTSFLMGLSLLNNLRIGILICYPYAALRTANVIFAFYSKEILKFDLSMGVLYFIDIFTVILIIISLFSYSAWYKENEKHKEMLNYIKSKNENK